MRDLQARHKEWCERNFPTWEPRTDQGNINDVRMVADSAGYLAHHALKSYQGIRGTIEDHQAGMESAKRAIISRAITVGDFENRHVFVGDWLPSFVGVVEEVGELAYAETKEDQIDAVGDIVLYLMDYCNKTGIDFEDAVRQTAEKVHARDWNANQVNGEVGK